MNRPITLPRSSRSLRAALRRSLTAAAALGGLAASALLPGTAAAQDYMAFIQQQMAQMNATVGQAQQQVGAIVAQKMRDPAVQRGYQEHVARARMNGIQPWSFEQYAYNYAYTNGFSASGTQAAMRNEANVMAQQQQSLAALRAAEANRAAAMQGMFNGQQRIATERGNGLMGNSTFMAPNGFTSVLPHTWQPNTYNQHNGNTYYVDPGGRYYAWSNGFWVPLTPR